PRPARLRPARHDARARSARRHAGRVRPPPRDPARRGRRRGARARRDRRPLGPAARRGLHDAARAGRERAQAARPRAAPAAEGPGEVTSAAGEAAESPAAASPAPAPGPAPAAGFFDRFSERQMALFVILFGLLLYVPLAGTYGLWDPWETHYSEVAR